MNQQKVQTLKGFRDFLPETMAVRNYVKNLFIEVFESFGFEPLETPALEYASTLMGKYGAEADKLVYAFTDAGDRAIGLRYDLTVPTAKVLALNPNLPKPFKRYQIQPVYRAEKPQKGRYREVLQCDIDIFGISSPIADAEIVAVIDKILQKLNFKKYSIRLNSRNILNQILVNASIDSDKNSILQSLDKFQKIGEDGVTKELNSKGLNTLQINSIFEQIKSIKPDQYLEQVFTYLDDYGVSSDNYCFDPTMVRGLDYYTGTIFETYVEEPKIGSITGGGRYDNLIKTLGGPDIPAVGTTVGLDRIVDCIIELNLLPNLLKTKTKVMVANFGQDKQQLSLSQQLRSQNINTLLYPAPDKLGKQFKYANDKNIPFVAVIGPDEAAKQLVTLKNMATGEQNTIKQGEIAEFMLK
ncbi:MAG: histidine--tRNA ligase [Microgenomates group bacterium]